ncbi:MAG: hypothetical protein WBV79_21100, partial [Rhodomicrobium sp.]
TAPSSNRCLTAAAGNIAFIAQNADTTPAPVAQTAAVSHNLGLLGASTKRWAEAIMRPATFAALSVATCVEPAIAIDVGAPLHHI